MIRPSIRCTIEPVRSVAADAQLVVLGPSLGTTTALWDAVVGPLAERYRVLRWDHPGHGFSPAAVSSFTIADLADAVIGLVDSVGGGSFHFVGISLAGAVGLELALRYPERLHSLALICTGSRIGTPEGWTERAAQVRASGTASLVAGSAGRWFAAGLLDRAPSAGADALSRLVDVDDESYALCCEALADFDVTASLGSIRSPTLCVSGEFDQTTPPASLRELAAGIPGARYAQIGGVAHLPAIERPEVVAELLLDHLPENLRDRGMAVRRAVLGDAHVDAATAAITPETADFQDFITRYAWGEIWARPGLDHRSRSLLTLAALVTGGHSHELAMHVRAALGNGLSRAEVSEAILHTAIYAGVPAANQAFAVARDTFAALDAGADST